jgi:transposase-like protein
VRAFEFAGVDMAIEVNGVVHRTIQEAARELGVTDKTLRLWINEGIVSPEPPIIPNGVTFRRYFPSSLIREYAKQLAAEREQRRRKRKGRKRRGGA